MTNGDKGDTAVLQMPDIAAEDVQQNGLVANTRAVMQGLDQLKNEHNSILHSLLATLNAIRFQINLFQVLLKKMRAILYQFYKPFSLYSFF